MNPHQKQTTEGDSTQRQQVQMTSEQIQTPPPPQVIDASKPPGEGAHETYGKEDTQQQNNQPDETQANTV